MCTRKVKRESRVMSDLAQQTFAPAQRKECFGREDEIAAAVDMDRCPCDSCPPLEKQACRTKTLEQLDAALEARMDERNDF
jgi:hypothetical protein